jgi:hypothetical protein
MNANLSRRLRKSLISLVILAMVLAVGMTYEAIGRVSDARRFPVAGQMVDVGGYSLNIYCTGVGTPTVITGIGPWRTRAELASASNRA